MISHQTIIQWQFLKRSVELEKIPHALLFYGSDSAELKTLALKFITLINNQDVEKGIQPDLFIIGPGEEKEIKIGQIRELRSKLSFKSYAAPFKSVIIEQAHQLNQEAQSAFLKLLEEPKGKTVFILITEYPEILLPTVLSRVERLRFYTSPLAVNRQEKRIKEILQMSHSDLATRFQYAKELSGTPQDLKEILDLWLKYFREMLLATVSNKSKEYSLNKLKNILKLIQTTNFLISTTNVNPRLALEILMLEL